ncbi:hypothetical protein DFQ28_007996 [Apophysomyces sp. BC1034]|nr:hypothetical protein DFQ29_005914 [Apophysomyces sp. BC1021]KAG0192752.1 hypothetical protein DFQ28_007996 [Apophysomyces sp. BC1034]
MCYTVLFDAVANIAVPVEALVSVLYWPMVLTAREMLVPKDSPFDLPLSLDLALHLWPTLFIWFDFLVYNTTFKRSSTHVTALYIFAMLYYVWTAYCFHRNGFWPYPFLGEFSHAGRAVLYMACGTLAVIMYNGGALIHSKIHKVKKTAGKKIK